MRICFYCDTLFSFGGVQRVLAVLAKKLSFDHKITILSLDDPSIKDTTMYNLFETNIDYIFLNYDESPILEYIPSKIYSFLYKKLLPHNKLFSVWYGYSSFPKSKRSHLIRILNQGDYDIVVGVHVFLSLHLASIKNKLDARVIGWMHSSYEAFFTIDNPYIKELKYYFKYMMPRLDKVIVLSFSDQTKYINELGFTVPPVVLYNPLPINPHSSNYINNKTFLAVGRFSHKTKGFDILIKAFALFAKENHDWTLKIVGDGPEKTLLKSLIEKYHLETRVTIFPFTKNIEVFYENASVFILSSRWEGLPLVLLEAMSYGLPIISSDLQITKELLSDKNIAIFFKNGDIFDLNLKMIEMVKKDELNLKILSGNSLTYVKEFSIDKIISQWNELLNDLKR